VSLIIIVRSWLKGPGELDHYSQRIINGAHREPSCHKFDINAGMRIPTFPICKTGKRACPPEDCEGVWVYAGTGPGHISYLDALGIGVPKAIRFCPRQLKGVGSDKQFDP